MTAAATAPALITAALPADPRWSRLPGITADGTP